MCLSLIYFFYIYRLLSGYKDKMYENAYFVNLDDGVWSKSVQFGNMQDEEIYRYFTDKYKGVVDFDQIPELPCRPSDTPTEIKRTKRAPPFRFFILALIDLMLECKGDRQCLFNINGHIRTQYVKCSPCHFRYDAVLKVSSMKTEIFWQFALNSRNFRDTLYELVFLLM